MARALVTGGTGFLGAQMCRELAAGGHEVLATYFHEPPTHGARTSQGVALEHLDVRERARVRELIGSFRPDVVYHFAGQAFVVPSWEDPQETFEVNVSGTLHLLEAVRRLRPSCSIGFAGSGTEYGDAEMIPTPESAPFLPTSPYATSKVAGDLLCYQYFRSHQLPVFRYRIFGTTGPGKRGDVCNDFASQIARGEAHRSPVQVRVGDLEKRRDIMDVRDSVRAMVQIVERGTPGEAYNIGSGEAGPIRDILSILTSMSSVPVNVIPDSTRIRLVDEPVHLGDNRRLRQLGWTRSVPMKETLRTILDGWRAELGAAPITPPSRP